MNRISATEGKKASNAKSKRERLLPSIFPSACGNASAVRRLLDSHPCSRPFFPILCRRSVYEKIFWWEKKWILDTVSRGGKHGSEFLVYLLVSFELNPSQHIISFDLFIFFLKYCQLPENLSEDSLFLHWVITYLYSLLYSFSFLRVTRVKWVCYSLICHGSVDKENYLRRIHTTKFLALSKKKLCFFCYQDSYFWHRLALSGIY